MFYILYPKYYLTPIFTVSYFTYIGGLNLQAFKGVKTSFYNIYLFLLIHFFARASHLGVFNLFDLHDPLGLHRPSASASSAR